MNDIHSGSTINVYHHDDWKGYTIANGTDNNGATVVVDTTSNPSVATFTGPYVADLGGSYDPAFLTQIDVGNYLSVSEGSESAAMVPNTTGSIAYDPASGNLKVTCRDLVQNITLGSTLSIDFQSTSGDFSGELTDYHVSDDHTYLVITDQNLSRSHISLPAGDYTVTILFTQIGDLDTNAYYDLTSSGSLNIPKDLNVVGNVPNGTNVRADKEGIHIACDLTDPNCSTYLDKFWDTCFLTKNGKHYYDNNSQLDLHNYNGRGGWFPYYWDDINPLKRITANGVTTEILVPTDHLISKGYTNGQVFSGGSLYVLGYETYEFSDPITLVIEAKNASELGINYELLGENDSYQMKITSPKTEEGNEFLQNLYGVDIWSNGSGTGTGIAEDHEVVEEENCYAVYVPGENLNGAYSIADNGTRKNKIVLTSSGYDPLTFTDVFIDTPFRKMPTGVQISVIGDGFLIKVINNPDNGLLSTLDDEKSIRGWKNSTRIIGVIEDKDLSAGNYFYVPYNADTWNMNPDGSNSLIAYTTYSALGLDSRNRNKTFQLRLNDVYYSMTMLSDYRLSLNPLILAEAAKNNLTEATGTDSQLDALRALDGYSITTNNDEYNGGLKNVTVSVDRQKDNDAPQVEIDGAVAAAITTSNSRVDGNVAPDLSDINYDDSNIRITVTQKIDALTDSEAQDLISKASDSSSLEATDVRFDIELSKSYDGVDHADVTVKELPYKAALVFDLPDEELESDEEYVLLREHDGAVEEIPYTVSDGKAVAYTDRFSSFVVEKKKAANNSSNTTTSTRKASGGYDDGSPFTKDAAGNVYDRWGNRIWTNPIAGQTGKKTSPATGVRK